MSKSELLKKSEYDFADLCEIVEILRAPDGCPWDKEQTHASIRKGLIEETYEAVEGIDANDNGVMCEELGDLLLQIVFHASIANGENQFCIGDVCTGICKKLIYRHPHIFGDAVADTSEQVLYNWDELKKKEKGQQSTAQVLDGVSRALPSLMRAQKLSKKAGEQYPVSDACDGIIAAAQSVKEGNADRLGELLFCCARLGNALKLDSEQILYNENEAFCTKKQKNIQ